MYLLLEVFKVLEGGGLHCNQSGAARQVWEDPGKAGVLPYLRLLGGFE